MGIASAMGQGMQKNMQNQMAFQKELILKQRQAQLATQIAMGRQRLKYYATFYFTCFPLAIMGAIKTKNPALVAPFFPISFVFAFQYDMCYGNMMQRARETADSLIVEDPGKFYLPTHSGIVTIEQYEKILGIGNKNK